jgi:hypothetical protein
MPLSCEPERLGSHSGTRVAVIIDEFQDMKFYVYNISKELFLEDGCERTSYKWPGSHQSPGYL